MYANQKLEENYIFQDIYWFLLIWLIPVRSQSTLVSTYCNIYIYNTIMLF